MKFSFLILLAGSFAFAQPPVLVGPISSAHPLYLYAHFRDDDSASIYFSMSQDALNYDDVNAQGISLGTTENRDPSIMYRNGVFYISSSPTPSASSKIQIWTSTDLVHFKGPTLLDIASYHTSPAYCCSYAPEWFADPVSGNVYLVTTNTTGVITGTGSPTFDFWFFQMNLAALTVTTATQVTVSGTTQNTNFDNYLFYSPGNATYYMMYVDEVSGGATPPPGYQQRLAWATSTSLLGPYAQVPATGVDTFGFSTTSEAPSVIRMPNNCWRVYADTWLFTFNRGMSFNAGDGRKYIPQYRDSCSVLPFTSLAGSQVAPININAAEHGTVLQITDPVEAQIVTSAAAYYRTSGVRASRLGIGTLPFFTMHIKSLNANGNLQYNEAPTFAAEESNGDTSVWSGCGSTALTCPPPFSGAGKWVMNHSGAGGAGMIQLNNSNLDTGEASIGFGNGEFAFGPLPLSGSSVGPKAIWSAGENNQYFGDAPAGTNVANNWLFAYNAGLGGPNLAVVNPGFEAGSLTGWTAGGSASPVTSPVHSGAYAASQSPSGTLSQSFTGLTLGTVYYVIAWVSTSFGATTGGSITATDGASYSVATSVYAANTAWQIAALQFTVTSTGNLSFSLTSSSGSGTVYWDDVQVFPAKALGAFPFGVSPFTGEVRVNYGLTLGNGDATALLNDDMANIDAFGVGFVNIGNGPIGTHRAYVRSGTFGAWDNFLLGPSGAETVNFSSPGAGSLQIGNGTPGDRSAIVAAGYVDVLNLFSVNGTNGVGGTIDCNTTTTTVSTPGGGSANITYCTSLTSNGFIGGIRTN